MRCEQQHPLEVVLSPLIIQKSCQFHQDDSILALNQGDGAKIYHKHEHYNSSHNSCFVMVFKNKLVPKREFY